MKLGNLQILRGTAAAMVAFHHFADALVRGGVPLRWLGEGFCQVGAAGVDLFFVISGFVMVHVGKGLFGQPKASFGFLLRRAMRIYPMYWIVTLAAIGLSISGVAFRSANLEPGFLVGSLLCFPMASHPLVDQGWTLSFEVYFYLVFSVGLACLKSLDRFLVASLGLFLAGIAASELLGGKGILGFLGNPMLLEFWAGMGIARSMDSVPVRIRGSVGTGCIALGLAGLCLAGATGIDWNARALFWGVPAALIVAGAVMAPQKDSPWRRFLSTLGDSSYSMYLTHGFVALALFRFASSRAGSAIPAEASIALALLVALALGWLVWRFLEAPLQAKLASRLPRRLP